MPNNQNEANFLNAKTRRTNTGFTSTNFQNQTHTVTMGCASSTLLNQEEEFSQIGGAATFSSHIVSLTSSTYGLLTLDPPTPARIEKHSPPATPAPPPPPPPSRITLGSLFPSPLSQPRSLKYQPLENINSWDLMSSLDSNHIPTFRFSPFSKPSNPPVKKHSMALLGNEENLSPNNGIIQCPNDVNVLRKSSEDSSGEPNLLDGYEAICPPNGENKVVIYTTTLRGVRKTFDDCNAVRSAIEGRGISFSERDISMHREFRDELKELMKEKGGNKLIIPPRVFVKGRYIGGVEEVMKIVEEGYLGKLLEGLPKLIHGYVCEGCGGARFLPCLTCNGSCKILVDEKRNVIVKCSHCNENGLVLCPVCT